eukprot:262758_1
MANELPKHLQEIKDNVFIEKEAPKHTSDITDPDAFISLGIDNSWSIEKLISDFSIDIKEIDYENNSMIFDMIGIDTSIANAFRRVLLSEIPTMAIEDCCVLQNNSIIQDEVLCHRLGLIPIKVDPRLFDFIDESKSKYDRGQEPKNTLIFKLHIECKKNPKGTNKDPPHKRYINSIVTSKDIEWVAQPGQMDLLAQHNHPEIKMVYDDIIIAKLRPGQCIEISMRAIKGIGREHAKWSPVGTASYKLLPYIELHWNENINNINKKNAQYLKDLCPKNVFDIEDNKSNKIFVSQPRDCSLCRACIMDSNVNKLFGKSVVDKDNNIKYEQFVKLKKKRNHFIFTIESIGQYPYVTDLFKESINVLKYKCQQLIDGIYTMKQMESQQILNMDEDDDDYYQDQDDDMEIMD